MRKCCICGHETIWQSDFMSSEVGASFDEDIIIQMNTCPVCGINYYDFLELGDGPIDEEE